MTVDDGSALTGEVVFATPQNNASLSRQATANRALRLARGVYVTGTALPPEAVGYSTDSRSSSTSGPVPSCAVSPL